MLRLCTLVILTFVFCLVSADNSVHVQNQPWMTLPDTPSLPDADSSGYLSINNVRIWHAVFGSEHSGKGHTVIFIHGGLGNSNYWGRQIEALRHHRRVICLDSRGHGRSTFDEQGFSYELMASDVIELMDQLDISVADIVGWSDGGIIGLIIARDFPTRLNAHFCFAANSNPAGVLDVSQSPVFTDYIDRCSVEYTQLNPNPDQWDNFLASISEMWATQPNILASELADMDQYIWIVDADHEEAINRDDTLFIADANEDFGLVLLPRVSHFAFLQDSDYFTQQILMFFDAYTLSPASSLSTFASLLGFTAILAFLLF